MGSKNPVSDIVRNAVRRDGRTFREIANHAKIAPSQLSRFVAGERGLLLPAFDRLCESLGVSVKKMGAKHGV